MKPTATFALILLCFSIALAQNPYIGTSIEQIWEETDKINKDQKNEYFVRFNGREDVEKGLASVGCEDIGSSSIDELSEKCKNLYIFGTIVKGYISRSVFNELDDSKYRIQNAKFYYNIISEPELDSFDINVEVTFTENTSDLDLDMDDEGAVIFPDELRISPSAFFYAEHIMETNDMETNVLYGFHDGVEYAIETIVERIQYEVSAL